MIQRTIAGQLRRLSGQYPVGTVPRAFIARFPDGAVQGEIQRAPELLSEIQVDTDRRGTNGRFILTASSDFLLLDEVGQSLAGRTALLKLLPFSYAELGASFPALSLNDILFRGMYPRVYDQGLDASEAAAFYVDTYLERDVRSILNVKDLRAFELFLRLSAGRTAQLVNLKSLSDELGISHNTVKQWLSVLEASYIISFAQPHHANLNKRLVKSPKMYFMDTGLACFLMGIQSAALLETHPLRGPLFETFAYGELLKARFNSARGNNIRFYRDRAGLEVDFILDQGTVIDAVEVKSAATVHPDFLKSLRAVAAASGAVRDAYLLYGGEDGFDFLGAKVVPWRSFATVAAGRE